MGTGGIKGGGVGLHNISLIGLLEDGNKIAHIYDSSGVQPRLVEGGGGLF